MFYIIYYKGAVLMYEFKDQCKTCMCNFIDRSLRVLPMGIIVISLKGEEIRFINPRAEKLLERLKIRRDPKDIKTSLGSHTSRIRRGGAGGERTIVAVLSYVDRDGENIWYFLHEISEDMVSSRYECEIGCMLKMDSLLSIIRHELGNPLNSIKVTLEVLAASYNSFDDEKRQEYIYRSLEEIRRMEVLLKGLRDYKLQGDIDEVGPIKLKDVVFEIHKVMEADLMQRNVKFFLFCEPRQDVYIYGSRTAIRMVLLNVIKNALEALDSVEEPTISISGEAGEKYVYLMVRDNGKGIPDDMINKVFTPLFTTKETGSGLGLAISKNLMLKMGGNISIKSRVGEGTEVTLIFKRVEHA